MLHLITVRLHTYIQQDSSGRIIGPSPDTHTHTHTHTHTQTTIVTQNHAPAETEHFVYRINTQREMSQPTPVEQNKTADGRRRPYQTQT